MSVCGPLRQPADPSPGFQVASAHTLFNVTIALAFFPLRNLRVKVLERLLPEKGIPESESAYLRIAEHLRSIALTVAADLTEIRVCPAEVPKSLVGTDEEPEEEGAPARVAF